MRNHRILTLAGAGSAAAASLAIWAFLFAPSPTSTVEAATVFASFKEALGSGFQVEFENVGADGVRVDGKVVALFDRTEPAAGSAHLRPSVVYIEAHAVADDAAKPDVAGLDVDAAVALVPGREWAYVKLGGLPQQALQEEPILFGLQGLARNGLLLDLDGIMEEGGPLANIFEQVHVSAVATGRGGHASAPKTDVTVKGEVTIGATVPPGEDSGRSEIVVRVDGPHSGSLAEHHDHMAEHVRQHHEQMADHAEIHEVLLRLFTGSATSEDLDRLVSHLEAAATSVSLEAIEPGLHVLTATGFHFDQDPEAQEWLGELVLQIAYRDGVGLVWATLEHVGEYDGTIRFEMTDLTIDDELFDRSRYLQDGRVNRFNASQIMSMVGPHTNIHIETGESD